MHRILEPAPIVAAAVIGGVALVVAVELSMRMLEGQGSESRTAWFLMGATVGAVVQIGVRVLGVS